MEKYKNPKFTTHCNSHVKPCIHYYVKEIILPVFWKPHWSPSFLLSPLYIPKGTIILTTKKNRLFCNFKPCIKYVIMYSVMSHFFQQCNDLRFIYIVMYGSTSYNFITNIILCGYTDIYLSIILSMSIC